MLSWVPADFVIGLGQFLFGGFEFFVPDSWRFCSRFCPTVLPSFAEILSQHCSDFVPGSLFGRPQAWMRVHRLVRVFACVRASRLSGPYGALDVVVIWVT